MIGHRDVDAITLDRDQPWAEAVALYRKGVKWWLSSDIEAMARDVQAERLDVDPWHGDVLGYISDKDSVAPRQVIDQALGKITADITRTDSDRVCGILRRPGFERESKVLSGAFKHNGKYVRKAS